jgi:hypothetical protein
MGPVHLVYLFMMSHWLFGFSARLNLMRIALDQSRAINALGESRSKHRKP